MVPALTAQVVAELVGAGLSGQALVDACRRIEAEALKLYRAGTTVQPSGFDEKPTVAPQKPTVGAATDPQPSVSGFVADGAMRDWADPWALAEKRDPMVVRRALETVRGLTRKRRAVGLAIVGRYHRESGRCDPSAETIAEDAGCNRALVFEALKGLERMGLIVRKSYGSEHHSNAYALGFSAAARILAGEQPSGFDRGQPSETDTNPVDIYIKPPIPGGIGVRRGRKRRGIERLPGQRELPVHAVVASGGRPPTADERRAKAVARLHRDYSERLGGRWIKPDPAAWDAGVAAEERNPGSGLDAHDQAVMEGIGRAGWSGAVSESLAGLLGQCRTGTGPPGR